MAKSKKKKRLAEREKRYPPLSKTDKLLYMATEVIGAVFIFAYLYEYDSIIGFFVFKNPNILSFQERFTMFLMAPFILVYLFGICDSQYNRKPVFGNKNVDYYNTLNYKFILPLFDKRYKNIERFKEHRRIRLKKLGILLSVLFILFVIGVSGSVGRHEFSRESITTYSIFNNVIDEYSYDEIESYSVEAYYHRSIKPRLSYTDSDINLTVRLSNDDSFTASYDTSRNVYALEEIENLLKGKKKTVDSRYLQEFISRHSLSEDELKVIYRLFDM